jgi:hypothetical protein
VAGEELRVALTRRWLVCSDLGLFHRPQAGMEIRPDGRISLLGWTPDGQLEVLRGADNEGTLTITNGGMQANFTSDLGGTVITFPVMSETPPGLWINNNGAFHYDYIGAEVVALGPGTVPPPPPPPPVTAPQCQRPPGAAVMPGTIQAMRQALSRRWLRCSPLGLFGEAEVAGLEISTDDRWYYLVRNAQGQLVRSSDGLPVSYLDTSSFNGRPTIQVNFESGRGTIISHPVITADPTWVIINNNGVQEYRYVAVD